MAASFDTSFLHASGYRFEKMLSTEASKPSLLCLDERGKRVLMKRLEHDCLHGRQLHPAIKERLARIRELPHPRLAILRGVECFGEDPYLVWNYVNGSTWEQAALHRFKTNQTLVLRYAEEPGRRAPLPGSCEYLGTGVQDEPSEMWGTRARELIMAVDTLHLQGIVHGSLHGRNVIVADTGEVWLTDVSPYLYTDPAVDMAAVLALLRESIAGQDDLGHVTVALDRFDPEHDSLRELLNVVTKSRISATDFPKEVRGARWRPLIAAALIAVCCVAIAFAMRAKFR